MKENGLADSDITWKCKEPRIDKTILKKGEQSWKTNASGIQNLL